jgi:nucleoside-diphosphate-sugar epimerase
MARVVVIGGSGHVGTYLLPALVARGHEVINVSRGTARPYREHSAWKAVEQVAMDRRAEEKEGRFGSRIAELNPDIVVDMISFELERTQQLIEAYAAGSNTICFVAPSGSTVMRPRCN